LGQGYGGAGPKTKLIRFLFCFSPTKLTSLTFSLLFLSHRTHFTHDGAKFGRPLSFTTVVRRGSLSSIIFELQIPLSSFLHHLRVASREFKFSLTYCPYLPIRVRQILPHLVSIIFRTSENDWRTYIYFDRKNQLMGLLWKDGRNGATD